MKTHFRMGEEELTACGMAGQSLKVSDDPEKMDCGRCKRSVRKIDGTWRIFCAFTQGCSGCSCDCGDGYPCGHENHGCHECGYTGKRRAEYWIPLNWAEGVA